MKLFTKDEAQALADRVIELLDEKGYDIKHVFQLPKDFCAAA